MNNADSSTPYLPANSRREIPPSHKKFVTALKKAAGELTPAFGSLVFLRGRTYAQQKRVSTWKIKNATPTSLTLTGDVQGSTTYQVTVDFELYGHGIGLSTHCTCPFEFNCKHAVALLLTFYNSDWVSALVSGTSSGSSKLGVTQVLSQASSEMEEAAASKHINGTLTYSPLPRWIENSIGALASTERTSRVDNALPQALLGFKLTLDKSSPKSQLVRVYIEPRALEPVSPNTPGREHRPSRNTFADVCARGVLDFSPNESRLFFGLCAEMFNDLSGSLDYSHNHDDTAGAPPNGHLLLDAVTLNRCYLAGAFSPLKKGPVMKVSLGWRTIGTGTRMPVAIGLGSQVKILNVAQQHLYLNLGTQEIGVVECEDQKISIIDWLSIPPCTRKHTLALAASLQSKNLPIAGLEDIIESNSVPRDITPAVHLNVIPCGESNSTRNLYIDYRNEGRPPVLLVDQTLRQMFAVEVTIQYGSVSVPLGSPRRLFPDPDHPGRSIKQNEPFENRTCAVLESLGLRQVRKADKLFQLPELSFSENDLTQLVPLVQSLRTAAQQHGWHLTAPDYLTPIVVQDHDMSGALIEDVHGGWFEAQLSFQVQGENIDLGEILCSLLRDRHYSFQIFNPYTNQSPQVHIAVKGKVLAFDTIRLERLYRVVEELGDLGSSTSAKHRGKIRMSTFTAYAFENAIEGICGKWQSAARITQLRRRIAKIEQPVTLPTPAGLQGQLREYQCQGLAWLAALSSAELGGILADDMGLGKTIQLISLLLHHQQTTGKKIRTLVVCPKSVAPNWMAELSRFAPSLSTYSLTGLGRVKDAAEIPDVAVLVTTYPILLRDGALLATKKFDIAIFDEAQHIKNPQTGTYHAANSIQARIKLPVSGTPLENNLQDLWAHFNLTMPGFLGSLHDFKRLYRTPIEKEGDTERRAALAARIRPFVLRRTKQEVAKELPQLTEVVHHCSLEGDQRDLYETIRQLTTKKVREALKSKGAKRSHIEFLDALLKLRQVCCDPQLVKSASAKQVKTSAKLNALFELLEQLLSENRSVIICSQFTSMLKLIEKQLAIKSLPYVILTGDTADRETPTKEFQSGKVKIFLMSLKAGGVGINLTEADTVIMYDPWWNPAAEAQAICRAHRIGQKKPVFAYRLIAEGSIEEKILELQKRKRALVENLLSDNARPPQLSEELVDFLFAPIAN